MLLLIVHLLGTVYGVFFVNQTLNTYISQSIYG